MVNQSTSVAPLVPDGQRHQIAYLGAPARTSRTRIDHLAAIPIRCRDLIDTVFPEKAEHLVAYRLLP